MGMGLEPEGLGWEAGERSSFSWSVLVMTNLAKRLEWSLRGRGLEPSVDCGMCRHGLGRLARGPGIFKSAVSLLSLGVSKSMCAL